MYILNLAYPENRNSTIRFKVSKFPDGQQSITIKGFSKHFTNSDEELNPASYLKGSKCKILSHLNTFQDLELIICATKALQNLEVKNIELFIPYLIGGRSDRRFEIGGVNYIKDVIAPIINSMNYDKVLIHTPHSDVTEACINNIQKISNTDVVEFAINNIMKDLSLIDYSQIRLLSPDAGALKRVYDVAENIKYQQEIIIAAKHRNPVTGQITHTSVPMSVHDADKHIVIIDDLIDGGRTFIEIAKTIKEQQLLSSAVRPDNHGKIYLVATHGVFSGGFKELNKYFDSIYCTNSYSDMNDPQFSLANDNKIYKLKQLNIF
jgi:ribose-phosphate pyrophosphokinase